MIPATLVTTRSTLAMHANAMASASMLHSTYIVTLSFLAPKLARGHTFEYPAEDNSTSQVLRYETSQLEPSAPATDLFLFSHEIAKGQSGSPVVAQESGAVVGLVEGRWLRPDVAGASTDGGQSTTSVPGAAVPIRYAIALLEQKGISWHSSAASPDRLTSNPR